MLLLEASHGHVGFRAELSIDRDALTGAAEGELNLFDIPPLQRRVLQLKLSGEFARICAAAKESFCFRTDRSVRLEPVVALKSTDCRRGIFSKDAVNANGNPLLPQEPLQTSNF